VDDCGDFLIGDYKASDLGIEAEDVIIADFEVAA
jgi:hypothetical protein